MVARLIERSARLDPTSDTDHVPLNLACERGSEAIVALLLKHGARILADAEGLYPQHLVARSGRTPELLLLLKNYGADLNKVDKLYGWTPLVHAASEGNVPCLQALLEVGADPNILDEKDLPPMYYAAWEGHLECMQLLAPYGREVKASPVQVTVSGPLAPMGSSAPMPMSLDPDAIPVLELPPPIIPLRRYGHNFLDTKTVVQINFGENGEQPLVFFHDSKYPAARLTISSKISDLIPKNIMLPFQEDTRLVTFQTDNLESFTLDLDVFPAYGAKVIAKTVALPNTFRALLSSSGTCCLPLFDPRLRAIGQISFHTQVIKPFQGKPLEITDFETYWKATSQMDTTNASTFVTGSSLSGDFVRIYVQHTSDRIPVLWPSWTINCGGIDVPVARLTFAQFSAVTSAHRSSSGSTDDLLRALPSYPASSIADIHRLLATAGITLHDALTLLPKGMHVNIQVLYPRPDEDRSLGLGFGGGDVNSFVDGLLTVVFAHARAQRAQSPDAVRSVVFSSFHASVCAALNWKQPNFPVFLCNDLGRAVDDRAGGRGSSVKDAVRTAQSNNLMGLICSSQLLVSFCFFFVSLFAWGIRKAGERRLLVIGGLFTRLNPCHHYPFSSLPPSPVQSNMPPAQPFPPSPTLTSQKLTTPLPPHRKWSRPSSTPSSPTAWPSWWTGPAKSRRKCREGPCRRPCLTAAVTASASRSSRSCPRAWTGCSRGMGC